MCRALEQMKETARQKGFQEGFSEGRSEGRSEGFSEGRSMGYNEGRSEGFGEGRSEGIQFMAALMLEAGYPFEKICAKIVEKYGMTREEAEACIKS